MILLISVLALVGLAAVTPALVRAVGRDGAYVNAAVFGTLAVLLGMRAPDVLAGDAVTWQYAWLPDLGLHVAFRMDGLGLLFALIVLGIGALVMAYSARYFGEDRKKAGRYVSLLTFFGFAMLGLVLADDLILLFVFWELTSVSSFFLIGGKGEGGPGATRAFLVTALGGLALFAGSILIGTVSQTFSIAEVLASPQPVLDSPVLPAAIILLLLAAATKSALFPFQFWLPGAMVAPTPVSTYLHAATMVKAGIYLLFRFTPMFGGVPLWQVTLVLLGLGTSVFASFVALKATDLKRLLAYSTVSQLGLLAGIIGIGTPLALAAAALHTLAHALYKAALFMTVGVVDHEAGTRDLTRLGGLRRTLPLTAAAGGLAAVSMAGIPPLLGFISKEEALASFVKLGDPGWLGPVAALLAVVASIGTFAYSARYYLGTFEGEERTPAHRAPALFDVPALLAAITGLGLGLVVPLLDNLVNAVSVDTTGTSADLHLALWHGFTVPLALSAIIVTGGALLVATRKGIEAAQQRVSLPEGPDAFDRVYDATLALGARVGRPAASSAPAAYFLPIIAVVVIAGVGAALVAAPVAANGPAPSQVADWAVVLLLAGCIGGVIQARSRLAAVATLGLAGFTVAAWFVLLGAPDLALTQLLVETLTVALVVVVFRRLPVRFERSEVPRKAGAGVIAIGVGVLAGAAAYLLAGRRPISEVGERFLAEGEGLTGGINVVNTILVDFRALDTMGEIAVLGVAAAGILALVRMSESRALPRPTRIAPGEDLAADDPSWAGEGMIDSPILGTAVVVLAPVMVGASLWLLLRGHDAVGGGFIGGLTAGAAVVALYFARGHGRIWQSRLLRIIALVGSGLTIALAYGLGGLVFGGSFLAGAKVALPFGIEVAASLVFDIGVYLVVVGVVVAIVRHLGQGINEQEPDPGRFVTVSASSPTGATDRRGATGATGSDVSGEAPA
jgi:multicomponent Na+:H+ antiporter subunit A